MLISKKTAGPYIMLALAVSVYPFDFIQAESAGRAPVPTIASMILEAVSAPRLFSEPYLAQNLEQMTGDFSLAASTYSDEECLKDAPLQAGINFEKELDCQGQLLDLKAN